MRGPEYPTGSVPQALGASEDMVEAASDPFFEGIHEELDQWQVTQLGPPPIGDTSECDDKFPCQSSQPRRASIMPQSFLQPMPGPSRHRRHSVLSMAKRSCKQRLPWMRTRESWTRTAFEGIREELKVL